MRSIEIPYHSVHFGPSKSPHRGFPVSDQVTSQGLLNCACRSLLALQTLTRVEKNGLHELFAMEVSLALWGLLVGRAACVHKPITHLILQAVEPPTLEEGGCECEPQYSLNHRPDLPFERLISPRDLFPPTTHSLSGVVLPQWLLPAGHSG